MTPGHVMVITHYAGRRMWPTRRILPLCHL